MAEAHACKEGATQVPLTRGPTNDVWHKSWETAHFQLGNILYTFRYQYGRLLGIFLAVDLMVITNKALQLGMCNPVRS